MCHFILVPSFLCTYLWTWCDVVAFRWAEFSFISDRKWDSLFRAAKCFNKTWLSCSYTTIPVSQSWLLHTGASCCVAAEVLCFETLDSSRFYCVITTAGEWWKIQRECCKTWGKILGEWQMACSRLALPECSLPLWEAWPGLLFLICVLFHKARFRCPVSHFLLCFQKPHATLFFFCSSSLPLVVIVVLYFPETSVLSLSQNLQSLPANWCWARKCFCLWFTRQEVSSWKAWNFFPPPTT